MPALRRWAHKRLEMRLRFGIERLEQERRAGNDALHVRVLAVEDAQRIAVQAPLAVLIELRLVRAEIRGQPVLIGGAHLRRSERIDQQFDARQSEPAQQPRGQQNQFRVDVGPLETKRLGIDLMELPVASRLRPLASEHRTHAPDAQPALAQQPVRYHRAHDAGGRFGPQA